MAKARRNARAKSTGRSDGPAAKATARTGARKVAAPAGAKPSNAAKPRTAAKPSNAAKPRTAAKPSNAAKPGRSARPSNAKARPGAPRRDGLVERPTIRSAKEWARKPSAGAAPSTARRTRKRTGPKIPVVPGLSAITRGGFQGFVILLFGELLTLPFRGNGLILYWVALVAYAWAGNRAAAPSIGDIPRAARDGALAAVFAYLLTLPLRQMSHSTSFSLLPTIVALVAAIIVGGLAGVIVARARRSRLPAED